MRNHKIIVGVIIAALLFGLLMMGDLGFPDAFISSFLFCGLVGFCIWVIVKIVRALFHLGSPRKQKQNEQQLLQWLEENGSSFYTIGNQEQAVPDNFRSLEYPNGQTYNTIVNRFKEEHLANNTKELKQWFDTQGRFLGEKALEKAEWSVPKNLRSLLYQNNRGYRAAVEEMIEEFEQELVIQVKQFLYTQLQTSGIEDKETLTKLAHARFGTCSTIGSFSSLMNNSLKQLSQSGLIRQAGDVYHFVGESQQANQNPTQEINGDDI